MGRLRNPVKKRVRVSDVHMERHNQINELASFFFRNCTSSESFKSFYIPRILAKFNE